MSQTPRHLSALTSPKRLPLTVFAAVCVLSLAASNAVAGPSGDLFNLVNQAHMAAGCPSYGQASQLNDLAGQYAKSMAQNGGRTQTTAFHVNTDQMLAQRGYFPAAWGEMDYYNPNGSGSPRGAFDFWQSQGTRELIKNCGITQLAIGVWIVGNNWAASAIAGTPGTEPAPGPAPKVN